VKALGDVASPPAPSGPKTGSGFARQTWVGWGPIRAETRQLLSDAVWGAFRDQGSVCAHRRPDPHSTVGERPLPPSLLHVELEQSGEPPARVAAHEVLGT
jgi:hypothetical protein